MFVKIKRFIAVLVIIGFLLLIMHVDAFSQEGNIVIPKDKVILVEILDTIDSGTNKTGDKVHFEIRENVVINNAVLIPYGTKGAGAIEEVHRAGCWGKGGYFKISFGSLKTVNGVSVPVEIGKAAQGAQQQSGVILPVIGALIFLPLLLFGFTKGKEAHIAAGTQMYVNTRNDVDIGITADQLIADYGCANTAQDISDGKDQAKDAAENKPKDEKVCDVTKQDKPPLNINAVIICKEISSTGDPVGVNTVFSKETQSLSIWCSFDKVESNALLEGKWYYDDKLIKNKQLYIDAEKGESSISGTVNLGNPFSEGDWKIDLCVNGKVIKSTFFKIK
ncbi:MAG: hypothetical protein ABIH00_02435 [Armatimonadota bacterium]